MTSVGPQVEPGQLWGYCSNHRDAGAAYKTLFRLADGRCIVQLTIVLGLIEPKLMRALSLWALPDGCPGRYIRVEPTSKFRDNLGLSWIRLA